MALCFRMGAVPSLEICSGSKNPEASAPMSRSLCRLCQHSSAVVRMSVRHHRQRSILKFRISELRRMYLSRSTSLCLTSCLLHRTGSSDQHRPQLCDAACCLPCLEPCFAPNPAIHTVKQRALCGVGYSQGKGMGV